MVSYFLWYADPTWNRQSGKVPNEILKIKKIPFNHNLLLFQFATVEVIITSVKDGIGGAIEKYLKRHEILVFVVCVVSFVFGLPFIFQVSQILFEMSNIKVRFDKVKLKKSDTKDMKIYLYDLDV